MNSTPKLMMNRKIMDSALSMRHTKFSQNSPMLQVNGRAFVMYSNKFGQLTDSVKEVLNDERTKVMVILTGKLSKCTCDAPQVLG